MTTITTRSGKGSPLTNNEVDANFTNLNDDKVEASGDSMTGNLSFGDNNKVILGSGNDLQLYHDASNSYIIDNGTGSLFIRGNSQIQLQDTNTAGKFFVGTAGGAATLYHNNSAKLATTATGIDVTGTVVSTTGFQTDATNGYALYTADPSNYNISRSSTEVSIKSGGSISIVTGASQRALFANNGDVSLYEDTGTTAKLFWDASEEKLGIGTTSSIDEKLTLVDTADVGIKMLKTGSITTTVRAVGGGMAFGVDGGSGTTERMRIDSSGVVQIGPSGSTGDRELRFETGSGSASGEDAIINSYRSNADLILKTNDTERMRIDASGNVGIGTSPLYGFHVQMPSDGSVGTAFRYIGATNNTGLFLSVNESTRDVVLNASGSTSANLVFSTTDERMRIDSSGDVGIGVTSPDATLTVSSGSANNVANFKSTDGTAYIAIADNSSTSALHNQVGVIGDNMYFATNDTERMRIDASGRVGIGTSSPSIQVDVENTVANSGGKLRLGTSDSSTSGVMGRLIFGNGNDIAQSIIEGISDGATDASALIFKTEATGGSETERMRIDSVGNVGIGTTAPSGVRTKIKGLSEATSLATSATSAALFIEPYSGNSWGLGIGSISGQIQYIQGVSAAGDASRNLAIQPYGGNVGIGTSSPDGLLDIEGNFESNKALVLTNTQGTGKVSYIRSHGGNGETLSLYHDGSRRQVWDSSGYTSFENGGTERMRIDANGKVGIGTSNPDTRLQVQTTHTSTDVTAANSNSTLNLGNAGSGNGVYNAIKFAGNQQDMYIMSFNNTAQANRRMGFFLGSVAGDATTDERLSITGSGNVGIGTSSPVFTTGSGLEIERAGAATLRLEDTGSSGKPFEIYSDDAEGYVLSGIGSGMPMIFKTISTEAMRIDTSQNLLVGKTSSDFGTVGAEILPTGVIRSAVGGGSCILLNRKDSDGTIVDLRKDNVAVGSISSTDNSGIIIGSYDVGLRFRRQSAGATVFPRQPDGSALDATLDLGISNARFKDLYLSGGAYLGGTGSANHLDDYEEGTWTPTLITGGWTLDGLVRATYTKVGNTVHLWAYSGVSGTGSSADLTIGNLPFTVANNHFATGAADFQKCLYAGTYVRAESNTTSVAFYVASGSTSTNRTQLVGTDIGLGYVIFSLTYEAA